MQFKAEFPVSVPLGAQPVKQAGWHAVTMVSVAVLNTTVIHSVGFPRFIIHLKYTSRRKQQATASEVSSQVFM